MFYVTKGPAFTFFIFGTNFPFKHYPFELKQKSLALVEWLLFQLSGFPPEML